MSAQPYQIADASLRVSWDLGHGGTSSEYRIERARDAYVVSLSVSRPFPRPGGHTFSGPKVKEVLKKENDDVEAFLEKLSSEYNVFTLTDLKSPYPFLHPKFYRFQFQDARGNHYGFEYSIEASNHHNPLYQRLTEEFEVFFESDRVFRIFFEKDKQL